MRNAEQPVGGDAWFYLLAALCGIGAGSTDVAINDLLFNALLVLAAEVRTAAGFRLLARSMPPSAEAGSRS